jgi:hypothetical protein
LFAFILPLEQATVLPGPRATPSSFVLFSALLEDLALQDFLDRVARGAPLSEGGVGVAHNTIRRYGLARSACRRRWDVADPPAADDLVASDQVIGAVRRLARVFTSSPVVGVNSEQAVCLAEISVHRALVLHAQGALEGKDVLLLGDDDGVSLAIGFLGQALGAPLARRVVVLEADPAWIDLIRTTSQGEGLGVECLWHDLRDPLPVDLRGRFDAFATDPPSTTAGLALFVSRAVQALKPGAGRQGLLSVSTASPAELLGVQSCLVRMGLAASEVFPVFDRYVDTSGPRSSQLLVLWTTPATRALVPQVPYEGALYAGEAAPIVRFYVCTRCKARYRVGQPYSSVTAASLKAAGCRSCGHMRFRSVTRIAARPNRLPLDGARTLPERDVRSWRLPPAPGLFGRVRRMRLDGA